MISIACAHLAVDHAMDFGTTYTAVMSFERFGLPDRNIDGVHAIANTGDDASDDDLNLFESSGLQNGANHHDPGSSGDTALPAQPIGSHEGDECANEASNIINSGYDAFEIGVGVIECLFERFQSKDGAEHTLVITKQQKRCTAACCNGAAKGTTSDVAPDWSHVYGRGSVGSVWGCQVGEFTMGT